MEDEATMATESAVTQNAIPENNEIPNVDDMANGVAGLDPATTADMENGVAGLDPATTADMASGVAGLDPATTADMANGVAGLDPATTADMANGVAGLDPATTADMATSDALWSQIQNFMEVGGPVVWILTVMSVVALAIILMKIWQFFSTRPEASTHHQAVISHWRQGETQIALSLLKPKRPADELMQITMHGLSDKHTTIEVLKEELDRVATLRLNQLRAYLRPLEVIATLSPLLGLFGTVLGMIQAFQQMEAAGNQVDPSVLSGGIWVALLTTAVGLAVAIPTVMAHTWLERKVERSAALMNDSVTQLFTVPRDKTEASQDEVAVRHVA